MINNDTAQRQTYDYIISRYKTIKVKPGKCLWNFRCSLNSVHFARKKKDKKIAMCVYVDSGTPIIHFLNHHKGEFIDNTLGEWSDCYNYYFIRWIDKKDFWDVNVVFTAFRKELRRNLSWWVRLTSNYEA